MAIYCLIKSTFPLVDYLGQLYVKKGIYGRQIINAQDRLDQVKPALLFTPFITSCLSATSNSIKYLFLALLIKRFNEFLCITVTMGRIPSNAI